MDEKVIQTTTGYTFEVDKDGMSIKNNEKLLEKLKQELELEEIYREFYKNMVRE